LFSGLVVCPAPTVVQEANAIGTAYLRVNELPTDQPAMRHVFREYLDARLRVYEKLRGGPGTVPMRDSIR
jgi:hypothetical protein